MTRSLRNCAAQRGVATTLVAIALSAGALAACSKPASETAANATATASETVATVSDAATNAAGGALAAGGAVSPPGAPQNDAINGDANTNQTTQTAGSNSFTADQAKGQAENAGYTEVGALTKTADGFWTGPAKKDGKAMQISVDFKGAVSAK